MQVGANRAWRTVSLFSRFGCALSVDSELYCWGNDSDLDEILSEASSPIAEPSATVITDPVVDVEVGQETACAAMAVGRLLCWGVRLGTSGVNSVSCLCGVDGADLGEFALDLSLRHPQIHAALQIQPEFGRGSEDLGQSERHFRADRPSLS